MNSQKGCTPECTDAASPADVDCAQACCTQLPKESSTQIQLGTLRAVKKDALNIHRYAWDCYRMKSIQQEYYWAH